MTLWRRASTLLVLAALAPVWGCQSQETFARVKQIEHLNETIGGPAAAGAVGDYLLENDRIRLVVHGRPGAWASTAAFGGTIIDMDLQRPQTQFHAGRGLDRFFELGPIVNLRVPRPSEEEPQAAFTVVRAKASKAGGALLRVEGSGGNLIEAVSFLGLLLPSLADLGLHIRVDYELRPGEPFVRITTTAYPTGYGEDAPVSDLEGFDGTKSLLSILLGDLDPPCESDTDCPVDGETCQLVRGGGGIKACRSDGSDGAGVFGGWLALMGGKLKTFVPGAGFDPWLNQKVAVARGMDIFQNPVPFSYLAGVGDRVSYAFFGGEGDLLVPVASSNFTLAISNADHCPISDRECFHGAALRMRGFVSVGEGDVASAVAPYYDQRGITTGEVRGTVLQGRTLHPISGADVFVFVDPWPEATDAEVAERSYADLVAAGRSQTRDVVRPAGDPGVVTHMETDVGTDPLRDGDFHGRVPVHGDQTRVLLVARHGHLVSEIHPVRVHGGKTSRAVLVLPESGILRFETQGASGTRIPAKMTLGRCMPECAVDADCAHRGKRCHSDHRRCVPTQGCRSDADCDPDETCDAASGRCGCDAGSALPRELGGHWVSDGTILTAFTGRKPEELALPAGTYEAIFSRGFEYDVQRQFVTIEPSRTTQVVARVDRVVDTPGYVSADFHIHSGNSPDSGMTLVDRVITYAAEGVEFLSSSDHDVFTDYEPAIAQAGLQRWVSTQVGVETSPLMLGHFISFPMAYDETRPENMPERVAFDWFGRTPDEIMTDMRQAGAMDDIGAVVMLPHIFDYFNNYGLDPFSLEVAGSLIAVADPLFKTELFSGAFDSLEIGNGKNLDLIRRPTVGEIRSYNEGLRALGARYTPDDFDIEDYSRRHVALGRGAIASILSRSRAEQTAFMTATEGVDCGCFDRNDCEIFSAPDEAPCDGFRGVVDDWFRMLNRGVVRSAVANSDSHDAYGVEAGLPRNYVLSKTDQPMQIDATAINEAVLGGGLVTSYGPFIRFEIDGRPVGATIASTEPVTVSVKVQSPLWFDVDRVEIFRNGEVLAEFGPCSAGTAAKDCITVPNGTVTNLNINLVDKPTEDAWYVVAAMGISGKDLAPVYSSSPMARFGFVESLDSLFAILPVELGGGGSEAPSVHPTLPYALTNPIWVDMDGGGITPPEGDPPSWSSVSEETPGR